jgi:hypothetical protein
MSGLLERIARRRRTEAQLRSAAPSAPAEYPQAPYSTAEHALEPNPAGFVNGVAYGANGVAPSAGSGATNGSASNGAAHMNGYVAEHVTAPAPASSPPLVAAATAVPTAPPEPQSADPAPEAPPPPQPRSADPAPGATAAVEVGAEPSAETGLDADSAVTTEIGATEIDTDAGETRPPGDTEPPGAGFRERGRIRRRARYLRRLREIQLRDIGGFAVELHRFGRRRDDLVRQKVAAAAETDVELRALERVLAERQPIRELREAGIGGACVNCGALHGSADRFCAACGEPLEQVWASEPTAETAPAAAPEATAETAPAAAPEATAETAPAAASGDQIAG